MKIENKEEWLELVINYDACGTRVLPTAQKVAAQMAARTNQMGN